ncbi:MAG: hypothetical protein AVDCRST_MAG90-1374, partial [uncultured Microvirga sp.]
AFRHDRRPSKPRADLSSRG